MWNVRAKFVTASLLLALVQGTVHAAQNSVVTKQVTQNGKACLKVDVISDMPADVFKVSAKVYYLYDERGNERYSVVHFDDIPVLGSITRYFTAPDNLLASTVVVWALRRSGGRIKMESKASVLTMYGRMKGTTLPQAFQDYQEGHFISKVQLTPEELYNRKIGKSR